MKLLEMVKFYYFVTCLIISYYWNCKIIDAVISNTDCAPKDFGHGSFVCVCNSTYCDTLPPLQNPDKDRVLTVTSSKEKKRWQTEVLKLQNKKNHTLLSQADVTITIDVNKQFQKILGFGGAFTDATGINLRRLPQDLQDVAIKGYYGLDGLEYNVGRVPIAGTDFSDFPYTYDDLQPGQIDSDLKHFSLRKEEDYKYKIPFINKAKKYSSLRKVKIKLLASPWSGPGWMKSNGRINGDGRLKKEFYSTYASYLIKFLEKYESEGINFWGMTIQNEPTAGLFFHYAFNEMAWMPEEQGIFIGEYLGPQLEKAGKEHIKIFILDDQRLFLPTWAIKLLEQGNSSKYVDGIAVHWYRDNLSPAKLLDLTHEYFPGLPIWYTEACLGTQPWDLVHVLPGSWVRGEQYAKNIIENFQHWVVGWTDWNLALDLEGGPNWVQNFADSPILVNPFSLEFYRQPMFYALAHFSKIFPEGSKRIDATSKGRNDSIYFVAFLRPNGTKAITIMNKNNFPLHARIESDKKFFDILLDARSIVSCIWN